MKDNLEENNSEDTKSEEKSEIDIDTIDTAKTQKERARINLELIQDVPVDLEIELGRKRIPLEEVLKLEQGSVVSLDKTADDPIDLYVNGTLVANGMLITIDDEELGFQITDIVGRTKRIKTLKRKK